MRPGDVLEVSVEKIVPNGLGLGFSNGQALFIPLSAPGDRLRVEVVRLKGGSAFARILEIIEASPSRAEPACALFGECGGCDFQQLQYSKQLEAKRAIVLDSLERIGGIRLDKEPRIVASPKQLRYRLRTQVHRDPESGRLGFYKRQSHEVVEFDSCPVLSSELDQQVSLLRKRLSLPVTGTSDFVLAAFDGKISVFPENDSAENTAIRLRAGEFEYRFDARVFFQSNACLIEELVSTVVGTERGARAVDLYSGIGLFALPLSRNFDSVTAVEGNTDAVAFAKRSAEAAGVGNISFRNTRVGDFVSGAERGADMILVDPPRSGVGLKLLSKIALLADSLLVYVSCNPSTLARDVRLLIDKGFELEEVSLLDLFPQTHHVETVARLRR